MHLDTAFIPYRMCQDFTWCYETNTHYNINGYRAKEETVFGLSFSFSSSALDRIVFEEDDVGITFLRGPTNTFIKTTNNDKTLTIAA